MKRLIFGCRDRASDTYGTPFFTASVGLAIRSFTDEINRAAPDNQLFQHPEDFDLFELGVFDDSTGLFETGVPRQVSIGKDVKVRS